MNHADAAERRESCWMIEGAGVYWCGRSMDDFRKDPNDAVRFSRQEDAERVLHWMIPREVARVCRTAEHLFIGTSPYPAPDALDGAPLRAYGLPADRVPIHDGWERIDLRLPTKEDCWVVNETGVVEVPPSSLWIGLVYPRIIVRRKPAPPTPPAKVRRRMQANTEIGGSFFAHLVEHDESSECLFPPVCQPVPDPAPVASEPSIVDERPAEGRRWIVQEDNPKTSGFVHGWLADEGRVKALRELEPITEARLAQLATLFTLNTRQMRPTDGSYTRGLIVVLRELGLPVTESQSATGEERKS